MPNVYDAPDPGRGAAGRKVGLAAGAYHLGASVYDLAPGEGVEYHFHLQREELLIVLAGTPSLRTPSGWQSLEAGDVVSFPRGPEGAHGYENRTSDPVKLLVACEQNAPNISVYPDDGELGIFDAAHPEDRRFGARFRIADAIGGYGGVGPSWVADQRAFGARSDCPESGSNR
jgi:uncharacterized cupin superfamily protein